MSLTSADLNKPQKNWTEVFDIEDCVVDHFIGQNQEWVFEEMEKNLVNPKRAHSAWVLQFGGAMALIGQEAISALGSNLYISVTKSPQYRCTSGLRRIYKSYIKAMRLRFLSAPLKHKIRFPDEILKQYGLCWLQQSGKNGETYDLRS